MVSQIWLIPPSIVKDIQELQCKLVLINKIEA